MKYIATWKNRYVYKVSDLEKPDYTDYTSHFTNTDITLAIKFNLVPLTFLCKIWNDGRHDPDTKISIIED